MPGAIECRSVSKRYLLGERVGTQTAREALAAIGRRRAQPEEVWPLRDVSFDVAEGEALGIIGRNGAGKSTLLKVLSRITEPTAGRVRTRGRIGSLLEVGTGFHPELTGRENIALNGAVLGMSRREVRAHLDEIVDFAGVERFLDTPLKRYSSGMYLRLAFSVAAHLRADILLVDEVLAVGDAEFQRRCLGKMAEVERSGRTVLFVSHNLDAVIRLCSRSVWIDAGRVRADGPTVEVVDRYLSAGAGAGAERTWPEPDPAGAPPAAWATRLAVVDANGLSRSVLDRATPFAIEVDFTVGRPDPGLDLSVVVTTNRGTRVLDEALGDGGRPALSPGSHRARLRVPPILGVGDYTISLWIGTPYDLACWEEDAVAFRLEGVTHGRTDRVLHLDEAWTEAAPGDPRP